MSLTIRNVKKISRKGRKSKSKSDGASFTNPCLIQDNIYCSGNRNKIVLNKKNCTTQEDMAQPILYSTPPHSQVVAPLKTSIVPDQMIINSSQQGLLRSLDADENKCNWTVYNFNFKNNYNNWYLSRNYQGLLSDAGAQNYTKSVPDYYYSSKYHIAPQRQVNSRKYFLSNSCNNNNFANKKIAAFNKSINANITLMRHRRNKRNHRFIFWNQAIATNPLQNLKRYCFITNCPRSCNIDINININDTSNEAKEKEIINIKAKNANLLKCKRVLDNVFENYEILPDNSYPNIAEVLQSVHYVRPTKRRYTTKVKPNFKMNLFAKPFIINRKRMEPLNSPTKLLLPAPSAMSPVVVSKNKMCQTREQKMTNNLHPYLSFSQRHQVCSSHEHRRFQPKWF